jgi:hypothetical protein
MPGAAANSGASFTHGYELELVINQVELIQETVYKLKLLLLCN